MGGAANSKIWLDILTAVMDVPLFKMEVTDSCALGAAFIAACGQGWYKDFASAARAVVKQEKLSDTKMDGVFYEEKFMRYNETVDLMKKLYPQGEA